MGSVAVKRETLINTSIKQTNEEEGEEQGEDMDEDCVGVIICHMVMCGLIWFRL